MEWEYGIDARWSFLADAEAAHAGLCTQSYVAPNCGCADASTTSLVGMCAAICSGVGIPGILNGMIWRQEPHQGLPTPFRLDLTAGERGT